MQVSAFCRSSSFFFALAVVILVGLFAAGSPAVTIDDVHHCFPGHTPASPFSSSSPSPPPITTTLCFVLCSASRTVALGSFSVDLGSEIQQCVKPRMIFPALNTRNVLLVSSSDQIPTVDTTMGIHCSVTPWDTKCPCLTSRFASSLRWWIYLFSLSGRRRVDGEFKVSSSDNLKFWDSNRGYSFA